RCQLLPNEIALRIQGVLRLCSHSLASGANWSAQTLPSPQPLAKRSHAGFRHLLPGALDCRLDRATLVDLAPIGFSVAQKASALIQVVDRPAQLERRQGTIQASSTQLIGIERLQVAALLLVGWHEAQVDQALEEFAPSTQISVSSTSRLSSY